MFNKSVTSKRSAVLRSASGLFTARKLGVFWLLFISGCATVPSRPGLSESTTSGRKLLDKALQAHGAQAFAELNDVSVSYDGEWKSAVWVIQPILVDRDFRKKSEERILFPGLQMGQRHFGPMGEKQVYRDSEGVRVQYNGVTEDDILKNQAAAAVADAYQMFLLGPFYFDLKDAVIDEAPSVVVDGLRCKQILAILRPGFGVSEEDRVLVAIDAENHMVRRLRFTFNALPSTQGVVADVYPKNYIALDGVRWPTEFVEIIQNPLVNFLAHEWRVTGLDTNRGMDVGDLTKVGRDVPGLMKRSSTSTN